MQRTILWLITLLLLVTTLSPADAQYRRKKKKVRKTACQNYIAQGITGKIEFLEGNFMPGPGATGGSKKAVQRCIYVYKARKPSEGESTGGFYPMTKEKALFSGMSCKDGSYTIGLPEGYYSVFVLEDGKLYANGSDGEGFINPVRVEAGNLAKIDIRINYKAAY